MTKFFLPTLQRQKVLQDTLNGKAPKELFYGIIDNKVNFTRDCINTRGIYNNNLFYKIKKIKEIFLHSGFSKEKFINLTNKVDQNTKIISFTDWDSLNFGIYKNLRKDLKMIGGFHGLYNFYKRTPSNLFRNKKNFFKKGLDNLNHLFFFGSEDRLKSIDFFKLNKEKTSVFNFGIDTEFWKKENTNTKDESYDIFSIGSDKHRDYSIFENINLDYNFLIVTKLKTKLKNKNFKIVSASKNKPSFSDIELRSLYNKSKVIVVPLKQTFQPSGQSAVLQAMACGRVVILTETFGTWDVNFFKHNYNIIFIKPYDKENLVKYLKILMNNEEMRNEIGKNARKTAEKYFSIDRMNKDLSKLLNL